MKAHRQSPGRQCRSSVGEASDAGDDVQLRLREIRFRDNGERHSGVQQDCSASSRNPCSPLSRNGVRDHPEWCSASSRNRVHLGPEYAHTNHQPYPASPCACISDTTCLHIAQKETAVLGPRSQPMRRRTAHIAQIWIQLSERDYIILEGLWIHWERSKRRLWCDGSVASLGVPARRE